MEIGETPAEHIFKTWLARGGSGCSFAMRLARDPNIAFILADLAPDGGARITAGIDGAAVQGNAAIAIFPSACKQKDAVRVVEMLRQADRWEVRFKENPIASEVVGVRLEFRTALGYSTAAMGFMPSTWMPTTRQAPFLAVGVWGGGRANPGFKPDRPGKRVNFADAPIDLGQSDRGGIWTEAEQKDHDTRWSKTEDNVDKVLERTRYEREWLRTVAFCLPRAWVEHLR